MLIKRQQESIASYFEDSSNMKGGSADMVIIPETPEEVAAFLAETSARKTPVTISGGGTGTTGGRIPFGGDVLSLERLNRIVSLSEDGMAATVEAGTLVDDLKRAGEEHGLFYASHPTEKTAFIGGTIATNASGSRSFKYGPTRQCVKRLKLVLASGAMIEIRRGDVTLSRAEPAIRLPNGIVLTIPLPTYAIPPVKNAAGYYAGEGTDLIDLFIGQEGTLAVIVEAEMALVRKPRNIFSSFIFFSGEEGAWAFAEAARRASLTKRAGGGGMIDALSIEYFGTRSLDLLRGRDVPVPSAARGAIFFEQETDGEGDRAVVDAWLDLVVSSGASLDDSWVAMNEREAERFTSFRYAIPEAINEIFRKYGFRKLSTDIAVPENRFAEMMAFYADAFRREPIDHAIFGHISECHVHVNIMPTSQAELARATEMAIRFVEKGIALGGTVSAEHGIGKIKHQYLEMMYGRKGMLEMCRIKKSLDPHLILGRGTLFPEEMLGGV